MGLLATRHRRHPHLAVHFRGALLRRRLLWLALRHHLMPFELASATQNGDLTPARPW